MVLLPLLFHGAAQILARRAGADVQQWWLPHVVGLCVGFVGLFLAEISEGGPGELILLALADPMLLIGVFTLFAQHVVLLIVILEGLRALVPDDDSRGASSR